MWIQLVGAQVVLKLMLGYLFLVIPSDNLSYYTILYNFRHFVFHMLAVFYYDYLLEL